MIYRFKQVYTMLFPKLKYEDLVLVSTNIDGVEREIFDTMSDYDKKHSVNVLKGVLKNSLLAEDNLYRRLALLHDCGKDPKTTFGERVKYALFKVGKLRFHNNRGFEKLNDIDYKLALLVLKHHNKNIDNDKLRAFQKIDGKN